MTLSNWSAILNFFQSNKLKWGQSFPPAEIENTCYSDLIFQINTLELEFTCTFKKYFVAEYVDWNIVGLKEQDKAQAEAELHEFLANIGST